MKKFIIVIGLVFVGFIVQAMAQTNSPVPENWYCDARWKANFIFTGTVKKIETFKGIESDKPIPADLKFTFHKTILFEVEKFYKVGNERKTSNEFEAHTISREGETPFSFKVGEKYLVYVEREPVIPISKDWISANIILTEGLTAPIEKATETVAFLDRVYLIDFDSIRDILSYEGDSKVIMGGVVSGKATRLVKPAYPKKARETNASGSINVVVLIDETGKIILAKAICPSNPYLAEAAEQAALASSFAPTTLSGKAVKVTGVITYNFAP